METVSFEEFKKLDLRIGTILSAEEIEGADKLWKLTIDLGTEQKIICAGVKEHYSSEYLVGKQVPIVTNLQPRMLKGIESQGMLLMAVDEHDKPVLITPEQIVPRGTIIR